VRLCPRMYTNGWQTRCSYGHPDPGHDDNPTLGCSSSLEYYKKALSYFIPYRLASWNPMTNSGNPTRSQPIIDLIKAVKKKEVRKQGKATSAVRPLEAEEFASTLNLLRKYPDILQRFQMPALCTFQFRMIGCIDDCCKFLKENLTSNRRFPFTLAAKLCRQLDYLQGLRGEESRYSIVGAGLCGILWLP